MSPRSSGTSGKAEVQRKLIVSFHDVHPGSREVCARFLERVRTMGVEHVSLLVVPRWHGTGPISEDAACVAWLRRVAAQGNDICLHGFFHRAATVGGGPVSRFIGTRYTAGEGEFFQIDRATALDRLRRGLDILVERAGLPVLGFTPPAWLMSEAGRDAARECGLEYSTTFAQVELLQAGRSIAAPTIVYSCRSAWRRAVSRVWVRFWARAQRNAKVLRIAAHPGDFEDPRVESSLYARIQEAVAAGRTAVTYRDLLPGEVKPVRIDPLAIA